MNRITFLLIGVAFLGGAGVGLVVGTGLTSNGDAPAIVLEQGKDGAETEEGAGAPEKKNSESPLPEDGPEAGT